MGWEAQSVVRFVEETVGIAIKIYHPPNYFRIAATCIAAVVVLSTKFLVQFLNQKTLFPNLQSPT
jgi:hypothetical protein